MRGLAFDSYMKSILRVVRENNKQFSRTVVLSSALESGLDGDARTAGAFERRRCGLWRVDVTGEKSWSLVIENGACGRVQATDRGIACG